MISMTIPNETEHFSIDKRVPIALVLAFVGNLMAIAYMAASLHGSVNSNGVSIRKNSVVISSVNDKIVNQLTKLVRIDAKLSYLEQEVNRIRSNTHNTHN